MSEFGKYILTFDKLYKLEDDDLIAKNIFGSLYAIKSSICEKMYHYKD